MKTLALLGLLLLAPAARAQDGVKHDLDRAADDILHIWAAPFRFDWSDAPVVIGIVEVVGLTAVYDDEIQSWIRAHPDALPLRLLTPFRNSRPLSRIGRTFTLLPISGVIYLAGLAFDSQNLREAGIGCATADVSNTLARHGLARLLGRLRPQYNRGPYVVRPFAFGDWGMRSFPGGHGANIMACTSFWNNRFDLGAAEPLLYALATAVGVARVADEAHWTSDTVFGFIFGWSVGNEIADRYLERNADAAAAAAVVPRIYFGLRIAPGR